LSAFTIVQAFRLQKSIAGSWTGGAENFSFHLQPKAALANFRSAIRSLSAFWAAIQLVPFPQ